MQTTDVPVTVDRGMRRRVRAMGAALTREAASDLDALWAEAELKILQQGGAAARREAEAALKNLLGVAIAMAGAEGASRQVSQKPVTSALLRLAALDPPRLPAPKKRRSHTDVPRLRRTGARTGQVFGRLPRPDPLPARDRVRAGPRVAVSAANLNAALRSLCPIWPFC